MLLQLLPELLESFPRGFGIRPLGFTSREIHVLVLTDRRERAIEISRPNVRLEQCRHVGIAGAARVCDKVEPGTLAQLQILDLIQLLNQDKDFQKTIVMVTHDPVAARRAGRVLHLDKGKLVDDIVQEQPAMEAAS